ncbi:hypothetical protein NX059_001819 [Plenodomus lindquistii]|nr:hypothetical protein NX059_001819 [Plenodomus lindquistii]
MSGPERPDAIVETTRALKRKHLSADGQQDVDALDGIFKRIKTAVPPAPYVLSTPSLHPYTYHSRQEAYAWMLGHLWRHDEEHLQYRTYHYREPCQDCFELQAGEENEPEPERSRSTQPAKRKPNLSAFKVKQANGTVTPGAKTASPSLAPTKHAPEQANGVAKAETQTAPAPKPGAKSPSRPSNGIRDERRAEKIKADSTQPPVPSHTTTSRPKSDSVGSKTTTKSDTPNATPHGLPPILSPVDEPLGNPHGLPDILSPTLPTNIQAELDRQDVQRKRAESDVSTSSSDRKSQTLAVPTAHAQKPDGPVKTENRIRSVSVNGTSPNPAPVRTGETNRSMIVTLKFSKAKASIVKNLLRLPPKKKPEQKESLDATGETERDKDKDKDKEKPKERELPAKPIEGPVIKKKPIPKVAARRGDNATPTTTPVPSASTSAKTAAPATKVPEKRRHAEEEATLSVPAKRPRALSQENRPITPVQATSSPAPSSKTSNAQKTQLQYLTPKKDLKAVSMLRTASSESHDTTPGRSGTTPAGAKADSKAGPTSAPLAGKKQADIALLSQTSMKLNQMGRALKHEATKILTAGGKIDKQDEKRAAVTNLECILSYMAAYTAQDASLHLRNRPAEVEQTWKTLLPLCISYARCTKDFPHLNGLRSYLSSTIASAICTHVAQRGSSARTTHDSPQDMPPNQTPNNSTGNGSAAENLALLSAHTLAAARHFADARLALPMDEIQSQYRKTWAGRETNLRLARDPDKISGAKMAGPYFLPLGVDTSPIQAVRFGLRFLGEYCEREGLEWRGRVVLGGSE